jgi:hypothetical protein
MKSFPIFTSLSPHRVYVSRGCEITFCGSLKIINCTGRWHNFCFPLTFPPKKNLIHMRCFPVTFFLQRLSRSIGSVLDSMGASMEVAKFSERLVPSTRFVAVDGMSPQMAPGVVFVAPSASIIGDVTIGNGSRYATPYMLECSILP